MRIELEQLVAEAAGDVVDPLAAGEAAVEDRNLGLARRHEAAVDVADSLFHRARLPSDLGPSPAITRWSAHGPGSWRRARPWSRPGIAAWCAARSRPARG